MIRKLTYTLLLCVSLGQLAPAQVGITAGEARIAIAKLDTLDHLRSGAKNDSARIANLLDQVKLQEMRNLETGQLLTKATFNNEKAVKEMDRAQRQKQAWKMLAYITTAVAVVTGGLLLLAARR